MLHLCDRLKKMENEAGEKIEEIRSGVISAHKASHRFASFTFPPALFQLWKAGALISSARLP